jgi:phenylacetate-CoA ligase
LSVILYAVHPLDKIKIALARTRLTSTKLDRDEEHPLEALIELKVKRELKDSKEFRRALGRSSLGDVSRQDLVEYQLHKFRQQMHYVNESSIFYKKRFSELHLAPDQIKTFEDLLKVPVTEPADLAAEPYHFLCVSQSKVMRAFSTTGTTGQRKRLFYTQGDVLNIVDSIAAALRNCGMTNDNTLQIMFPAVSAWDPSLMLDGACKVAGLRSMVCSDIDIEKQISSIRGSKAQVIIGLTSFIHRITVLGKGKHDLSQLGIRAIICSSEPLNEAMRREIESTWGCKVLSQYGMTEMGLATAIECFEQDGMHIDEGNYMAECVDANGQHCRDRQPGEIIWTSLNIKGSPLLRYRSYDLSCYISPPCGCGFGTVGKMGKPRGRINSETKIGYGEKVFPDLFDEAIMGVSGVLGYQVLIDRPDYRDKLTFQVEYDGDAAEGRKLLEEKLLAMDEIRSSLDNDLLEPLVIVVDPVREGFVLKQKTMIDRRTLYDMSR